MSEQQSFSEQTAAVYGLIKRLIPGYENQFTLEIIEKENGKDVFEIDGGNDFVLLRGNNPVSLATALNHYLKYTVNAHVSWCGDQLNLPAQLPIPQNKYRQVLDQTYRVYQNYCTLNYSASWWNWERWEREIDFMALNGINMPLSVVGLEGVWYHTLLKFDFTDEEARSFLVGPAFFAWQWMTNIQSHGGPLPKSWIEKRIELGRRIIERQLEFGMHPIQQGFTGYLPVEFAKKYPEAKILIEKGWCRFPGTAQLDPLDPQFKHFGKIFLSEQTKLFGAHHHYAADPFHEGHPPCEDEDYLNKVGSAISELLSEFDPEAMWVMQAWSIRKGIATAVPKDKLLILDLNGKKCKINENFWGYHFVLGNLHNFGGRINLHGDLNLVASNQYKDIQADAPNVCGTGLFMEGIMQNPVYYDLAFEVGLMSNRIDARSWLNRYSERRYGAKSKSAEKAWQLLLNTAYRDGTNGVEASSIICARPAVDVKKSGPNNGFHIPYDNKDLLLALILLVEDSAVLQASDAYRYDIVDILRQVLSNLGQSIHREAANAFKAKNRDGFLDRSRAFLELLLDVDRLLGTREEFSFEKWVKDARSLGGTEVESDLYEWNATLLVTIWGPVSEPGIFDYSWREWSGLIAQYYHMRWKKFYQMLADCLKNGVEYEEEGLPFAYGRESFRANSFYAQLADDEMEWIKSRKRFPETGKVDEIHIVKELLAKYRELCLQSEPAGM